MASAADESRARSSVAAPFPPGGARAAVEFLFGRPLPAAVAGPLVRLADPRGRILASPDGMAGPSWRRLEVAAARQGLDAALAAAARGAPGLPPDLDARFSALRRCALAQEAAQTELLAALLPRLRRRGVPAIVLKGPAVSERLPAHLARQTRRDVDLLVRPVDLPAALAEVRALGFEPIAPDYYRRRHFHLICIASRRSFGEVVELHWDVAAPDAPIRFDVGRWFLEAEEAELRAGRALVPPRADEAVYVGFHAMWGGRPRLRELGDAACLWRALAPDARDRAAEAARRVGAAAHLDAARRLADALWPEEDSAPPPPAPRRAAWRRALFSPAEILRLGSAAWWPAPFLRQRALLPRGAPLAPAATDGAPPLDEATPWGAPRARRWTAKSVLAVGAAIAALELRGLAGDETEISRRIGHGVRGAGSISP